MMWRSVRNTLTRVRNTLTRVRNTLTRVRNTLTRVRELFGPSISCRTGYTDWSLLPTLQTCFEIVPRLRFDRLLPNPFQFSTYLPTVWSTNQRLKMNHQEIASFPSSKPNHFHKRGSYDRPMAVYPRVTGSVERSYNRCILSYFLFSF